MFNTVDVAVAMVLGFVAAWVTASLTLYVCLLIAPHPLFWGSLNPVSCAFVIAPFLLTGIPFGLWAYGNAETRLTAHLRGAVKTLVAVMAIILVPAIAMNPKALFTGEIEQIARFVAIFFGYGLGPALFGAAAYWTCAGRLFGPEPDIRRPIRSVDHRGDAIRG